MDNAIKYTERGSVEVALSKNNGTHRLAVTDTGPGIKPEHRGLIFEPFEQLEPLRRKHTPGVGLGLALVREMTGALGGRIELSSEVGVGSTFAVDLPPVREEGSGVRGQKRPRWVARNAVNCFWPRRAVWWLKTSGFQRFPRW